MRVNFSLPSTYVLKIKKSSKRKIQVPVLVLENVKSHVEKQKPPKNSLMIVFTLFKMQPKPHHWKKCRSAKNV